MSLNNYRVTFGGIDIDYKSNFAKCREYIKHVAHIGQFLKLYGVEDDMHWFFFEPYVEITWVSNQHKGKMETLIRDIENYLEFNRLKNIKCLYPEDGEFADWYFGPGNLKEREFSFRRYGYCARQSELFYTYMKDIENESGKSLEQHYVRSCHVLANQLALSYKEEGRLLFWRSILCKLFWWFGHKRAVWLYTKIFRQKY